MVPLTAPSDSHYFSYSRYLQEVGYTDTILDVKSQRVRALLGLAGDGGGRTGERTTTEPLVNGTDASAKGIRGSVTLLGNGFDRQMHD